MIWSGLAKFLLGFTLAIAILIGGGISMALFFINRVSTPPTKPVFANDTAVKARTQPTVKPNKASSPAPSPKPTPSNVASLQPLEPGAYYARVTWSQGLSLRSEPDTDAERIGSTAYNQQIVVLEESADKNWQRIRIKDSEQEGWVKAGNTERVN